MSHYISSFFIEPVVRQARRFSRSNADVEPPLTTTRRLFHGNIFDATAIDNDTTVAAAAATYEIQHITLGADGDHLAGVTADFAGSTPEPESGALAAELQDLTQGRDLASPLRRAETASGVYTTSRPPRRYARDSEVGTSHNPLHEEPDSFSSISGSVPSPIGVDVMPRRAGMSSRTPGEDDGSLSADDGMRHMRHKILAIQGMDMSNTEKARRIHELMTEGYVSSQANLHISHSHLSNSPSSLPCSDWPYTPTSVENTRKSVSPPSSVADSNNPFQVTEGDLRPTYFSKQADIHGAAAGEAKLDDQFNGSSESLEESRVLGCPHYKRNIKLQCSACERWYTCRFCHDEVEDHSLNRRETKNMLCMLCGCAQPASEECSECGERGAWYYCGVCKLWDDDPKKSIYHCHDCGICRVGQGLGKDFYHCKTCCVCLSISIRDTHRCIERSTDCDCPICGEYMFTSPQTVVFMRCGHSIHQRCYYEHMRSSYRCPICSRSIVNMEMQFRHLERSIETQPMPPQFQDTKAFVYCNDCSAKTTVKYHWLGLKCAVCDSYNTAQLQILSGPDPERSRAENPEPSQRPEIAPPTITDPTFRGRALFTTGPGPRVTTSAGAERTRPQNPELHPRRTAVSESPNPRSRYYFSTTATSDSDPPDSLDTDEDYSDVEFWGGESPNGRAARSPVRRELVARVETSDEEDDDDEDEEEDDDDDDDEYENISDDLDAEEEADEGDGMEIFGHR